MPALNDNLISDEMSEIIINAVKEIIAQDGIQDLNVRKVLKKLDITNRVFYNRFHNIGEVIDTISSEMIMKVRDSLRFSFDKNRDFFEQVMEVVEKTLILSYETRYNFAHYVFENDSLSDSNYKWWTEEIKKIIKHGIDNGYAKNVDLDMTSYTIWCFIRGFNADAIGRKLPLEDALKSYRYGFTFILKGLKKV